MSSTGYTRRVSNLNPKSLKSPHLSIVCRELCYVRNNAIIFKKKKQSLKRLQRLCSVITLCSILEAKFKEFTNEILPQDQLQRVLEIMWEHKLKSRILKINIQSCCHILQEKLNIISIIVKPTSSRVKQKSTIEN